MNNQFLKWKEDFLSKKDKSSVGEIDEKIQMLCNLINSRKDMFTTSSCSGRITLISKQNNKKKRNIWKFISHYTIKPEEIWSLLEEDSNEKLEFRQEGTIIHICVENQALAAKVMEIGKNCGFNQRGLISFKRKIIIELISDVEFSLPVLDEEILITKDYLDYIVNTANQNLKENWNRIDFLEKSLKNL